MSKAAAFTIADLDPTPAADRGREYEIKARDGKGTGMFLTLAGSESSVVKNHLRGRINADRMAEFEAQRKGVPVKPLTIEQEIARSIELLVAGTIGWGPNIVIKKEEGPLPFEPANVRRLYEYDFVRLQVEKEIFEQSDFTAG